MNGVDRRTKWPYSDEPVYNVDQDYQLYTGVPRSLDGDIRFQSRAIDGDVRFQSRAIDGDVRFPSRAMSLGRGNMLRTYGPERDRTYVSAEEVKIPSHARNVVSYTLPPKGPEQEPMWIVPPKNPPRYVTMEVKEPDPEPILVVPPQPPKERVIEYQVPYQPPPPPQEWVTVRQVVEEPPETTAPTIVHPRWQTEYKQGPGPIVTRLPEEYETRTVYYSDTLLGVPRTIHWELVLASFILWVVMLLIAIFVAGFLS